MLILQQAHDGLCKKECMWMFSGSLTKKLPIVSIITNFNLRLWYHNDALRKVFSHY